MRLGLLLALPAILSAAQPVAQDMSLVTADGFVLKGTFTVPAQAGRRVGGQVPHEAGRVGRPVGGVSGRLGGVAKEGRGARHSGGVRGGVRLARGHLLLNPRASARGGWCRGRAGGHACVCGRRPASPRVTARPSRKIEKK